MLNLFAPSLLIIGLLPIITNAKSLDILSLKNTTLEVQLTPQAGGRINALHLKGKANFFKVGATFTHPPQVEISADTEHIDYFGHIVWVGPQSQWWRRQKLNMPRFNASAVWPPDPYLAFADNQVINASATDIELRGVPSPVSGMRIDKHIALSAKVANRVDLHATAINISDSEQAWDLWFNTRVLGDSLIVVPVKNDEDVRFESFADKDTGPISISATADLLLFNGADFNHDKAFNKGKVYIQPAQGWMAAFRQGQLFIVTFVLQDKSSIHPQQGQIELYASYNYASPAEGLIEMEFHTPFKHLAQGEKMHGAAHWYLFDYTSQLTEAEALVLLEQKISWIKGLED